MVLKSSPGACRFTSLSHKHRHSTFISLRFDMNFTEKGCFNSPPELRADWSHWTLYLCLKWQNHCVDGDPPCFPFSEQQQLALSQTVRQQDGEQRRHASGRHAAGEHHPAGASAGRLRPGEFTALFAKQGFDCPIRSQLL